MKDPTRIIVRPLLTEKGTRLREEGNKYVFRVHGAANKIEIKEAIETLFKVKVRSVHTIAMRGKVKRQGRYQGRTSDWKKAIATLQEGQSIELFEGV